MSGTVEKLSIADCVTALRLAARGDLIAVLAGLSAVPLALIARLALEQRVAPALVVAVALAGLSFLAGTVAGRRAKGSEIPSHLVPASAVRWGARIGMIVFLSGAGLVLLIGIAGRIVQGVAPGDFTWAASSLSATAGVLLAMMPTIASGSFGCLTGLARAFRGPGSGKPERGEAKAPVPRGALPFAAFAFLLSLASPAVPALLASRRGSFPEGGAGDAPAGRKHFSYEVPADLPKAEASRWRVVAQHRLPGLYPGSAAALSEDGRRLAFTGGDGRTLTVFDLTRHVKLRDFPMPPVEHLAWSPHNTRIFCACAEGDSPFWVLDADTGQALHLPLRRGPGGGKPRWKWDNEVGFFEGERRVAVLSLDTLRLRFFAPASSASPEAQDGEVQGRFAETDRCFLSIRPRIRSLTSPLEPGMSGWGFEADGMLAVTDKQTGASFPLLDAPVTEGGTLLVSPDASKITVVTGSGATTHYVGLGDADSEGLGGTVPELPEHEPDSPLGSLAGRGVIGTFVCAPLVNPLNGRVVGPDTGQVRALAVGGRGGLRIAETYLPVRPGDVAGCLHYWQDGSPVLLTGGDLDLWWTQVSLSPSEETGSAIFPRWRPPYLSVSPAGIEFRGWREPFLRADPPPATMDAARLAAKPPGSPAASVRKPGLPPRETEPTAATAVVKQGAARVEGFVQEHHRKVGAYDLEGFVGDYAETVDLNDKGRVSADFIRREQAAYLPKYDPLSETVVGGVEVKEIAGGWRARYSIRSYAVKRADGKEFDRIVRLTLDVRDDGRGGLEIFRETAAAEK